ncbi:MAG: hypothetical protein RL173_118 [Fibrobacterota bacterium]|jgi:hypothetical protein
MGILVLCCGAFAQTFRCFESQGRKAPIQLQFNFPGDGQKSASVAYRKGSGTIEVKQVSEQEIEGGPEGRPSLIRTVWQESVPGGKGGRYEMDTQGAVVYRMEYKRADGKKFSFQEIDSVVGDHGCEWM